MNDTDKRNRFSIDLPPDCQNYLAHKAKEQKLTQGEIVELLLKNMHCCVGIDDEFKTRREEKAAARRSKSSLAATFVKLTPEQQAAALAAVRATS